MPVIAPGGLFSASRRAVPLDGTVLRLAPIFWRTRRFASWTWQAASCSTTTGRGRGSRFPSKTSLTSHSGHGRQLVSWRSRPGLATVIPKGSIGDLYEKPSMIILPPGASGRHAVRYEYLSDMSGLRAGLPCSPVLAKRR